MCLLYFVFNILFFKYFLTLPNKWKNDTEYHILHKHCPRYCEPDKSVESNCAYRVSYDMIPDEQLCITPCKWLLRNIASGFVFKLLSNPEFSSAMTICSCCLWSCMVTAISVNCWYELSVFFSPPFFYMSVYVTLHCKIHDTLSCWLWLKHILLKMQDDRFSVIGVVK